MSISLSFEPKQFCFIYPQLFFFSNSEYGGGGGADAVAGT